jgi:hypothetical protein
MSDRQVAAGPRSIGRTSRALGGVLGLLAVPFAVVGAVVNAFPATAVFLAGRRPAAPVTLATTKFLVGFVGFPITWIAWRFLVFDGRGHPWLWTLATGPICGLVAAILGHRLYLARLARLRPSRLVLTSTAAEDLVARRTELVAAVRDALRPPARGQGSIPAGSLGDRP